MKRLNIKIGIFLLLGFIGTFMIGCSNSKENTQTTSNSNKASQSFSKADSPGNTNSSNVGEKTNNNDLKSGILGAIIGGIATFVSEVYFRRSDNKQKEKHYASMLYYDLKSVEDYILNERSSVDIRYFKDWQHLVSNCSFLKSEHVRFIYKIYDLVYNFDFLSQKYKGQGNSNRKENQSSYQELQKIFKNDKYSTYSNITKELEQKIGIMKDS